MTAPIKNPIVHPYICFEGRCEEALNFYAKAIGAKAGMLMRFKDAPPGNEGCPGGGTPPPADKVMHSSFFVGESMIMVSDGMCSGKATFQGISLSLSFPTEAEAKSAFNALAEGGQPHMPLTKTFFSPCFGMVVDKFGINWMVIVPAPMP
ncbi:MAG TPA: VOC family protein [Verrucomicrobiae bacterium]